VLAQASGRADRLPDRHMTLLGNVDAMLAGIEWIERADLHNLGLRR
jgi:hypothetical protein